MSELYIFRHGQCAYNAAGRLNGRADPELTECGEQQALELARLVGEAGLRPTPGAVYASDLRRAYRTGEIVTKSLGLSAPLALPILRERHLGVVTGMTVEEAKALIAEKDKIRTAHGVTYAQAKKYGFETFKQATGRAGRFLRYVTLTHGDNKTIWAFTHGDFALAIVAARTGVPMKELIHNLYLKNTDVVRLSEGGKYELLDLSTQKLV